MTDQYAESTTKKVTISLPSDSDDDEPKTLTVEIRKDKKTDNCLLLAFKACCIHDQPR